MPQADAWQAQVLAVCAQLGVPLQVTRLRGAPARGDSPEAWARRHRYPALARMAREAGASLVLLGQHAHDQAETVLLQALRGAAAAGLAAMPSRFVIEGVTFARPWLHRRQTALQAALQASGLPHVHDPSNDDPRLARARLRTAVWPALEAAFPSACTTLADVARHAAQARALADEVAIADLPGCCDALGQLLHRAWRAQTPARQRNVLQAWLAQQLADVPVALVDRLLSEWTGQGGEWPTRGARVRAAKGRLRVERSPPTK